jgi:hypothetical protein
VWCEWNSGRQLQTPRQWSQLKTVRFPAQREKTVDAIQPHALDPSGHGCIRRHAQYRLNSDMAMFPADRGNGDVS